jgi:hypothetical protein
VRSTSDTSRGATDALQAWVRDRGRQLAHADGGRLTVVNVPDRLGDAQALASVAVTDRPLLQVHAENLSSMDLAALVDAHVRTWADLTFAIHEQAFRVPYGVVQHDEGTVTAYLDRPVAAVPVSSQVAVVGERALALLSGAAPPSGMTDLVARAVERGLRVRSVAHDAAWVHVDDDHALELATGVVRADPDAFELCWHAPPPLAVVPGADGPHVQIDDVDRSGHPRRVLVPRHAGAQAVDAVAVLAPGATARARAWLADTSGGTAPDPEGEDGRRDKVITLPADGGATVPTAVPGP